MNVLSPQAPAGPPDEEHTWEFSKENVMPVRRGRTAAALCALQPPSATKAAAPPPVEAQRASWEAELAGAADPLDVWVRYIRWSEDAFTTNASQVRAGARAPGGSRMVSRAARPQRAIGARSARTLYPVLTAIVRSHRCLATAVPAGAHARAARAQHARA
jgi:hypothetical protein